ncbi:MAG TPA: NAD-dependent epimerase/dehydratase family protein, partial [Chlamydiales bacterium]|nr:NAD-dependent epimerase/dehydratase family protein [Chlamydiales bacterium]
MSGSSGFIGSEVFSFLQTQGHEVVRLQRGNPSSSSSGSIFWDPDRNTFTHNSFENFDAVIHLAGEPLIGLWTAKKKERIFSSRIRGTQLLTHIFTEISHPPKVFVCASAIGFYGDRGEEELTEKSSRGKGFLSSVCSHWESATHEKANSRVRIVN